MAMPDMDKTVELLKSEGTPYVLATVVRTVAATAAKAGAKAVILEDGRIAEGWIGGGCARGAVLKASREALEDGEPRLVSVQPENLLQELGVEAGTEKDGIKFARNMCPSKGTMDIFIEPVLPLPELCVLGASPVAIALAELAGRFGFRPVLCAPLADQPEEIAVERRVDGFLLPADTAGQRFVVVSTQGKGDEAALRAALGVAADRVSFVGSKAKAARLREKLLESGMTEDAFAGLKAPAGLDIGAITPEEIALSILAEITQWRRKDGREKTA